MIGKKRCRLHGGKAGRPPSTRYKVYKDLRAVHNKLVSSPEMLDMSIEYALLQSRLQERMTQIEELGGAANFQGLLGAVNDMDTAIVTNDLNLLRASIRGLRNSMEPIVARDKVWHDLHDIIEQLRRLNETINRWQQANDQMYSAQQVVEFIMWVQALVMRYIKEPIDRKAFVDELKRVLTPVAEVTGVGVK